MVNSDARLNIYQIVSTVGNSAASVFRILKRNLKLDALQLDWIPYLLSDKQIHVRLQTARKLLKMSLNIKESGFLTLLLEMKYGYTCSSLLGRLTTKYRRPKTAAAPQLPTN